MTTRIGRAELCCDIIFPESGYSHTSIPVVLLKSNYIQGEAPCLPFYLFPTGLLAGPISYKKRSTNGLFTILRPHFSKQYQVVESRLTDKAKSHIFWL
jgi:hypothetical protein